MLRPDTHTSRCNGPVPYKCTDERYNMKRKNIFIGYLVLLIVIATFLACDSTPKQTSTGEQVNDPAISANVRSQLAQDDSLKQIRVETVKGEVQLSGTVDSQSSVDKAGQIAKSVQGVKSVKNALIVK